MVEAASLRTEERTACLDPGGFVFAVARYPEQRAQASVHYAVATLAWLDIGPNDEAAWAWRFFIIDGTRTCVRVLATRAHDRVYRLRLRMAL